MRRRFELPGTARQEDGLLVWLMPVYFAATFPTTLRHQPDPQSSFGAWSRFVTTDRFLVSP